MQFFRRLSGIRAISFDLDDTLYDNRPVMERAEQWMVEHMRDQYLQTAMYDRVWWTRLKQELQQAHPSLLDDVSLCRREVLRHGLMRGGMGELEARREAERVFLRFLDVRCAVTVPEQTHQVLSALSHCFPLVVITNGNVQVDRLGLDRHFTHVLSAGEGRRMKPAPDLFAHMSRLLGLSPGQILHVGDDVRTDVAGAVYNGYRSAWLNDVGQDWRQLTILPDVELSQLDELLWLV